jgi:hypothetical protein
MYHRSFPDLSPLSNLALLKYVARYKDEPSERSRYCLSHRDSPLLVHRRTFHPSPLLFSKLLLDQRTRQRCVSPEMGLKVLDLPHA